MAACVNRRESIVLLLLAKGADVDLSDQVGLTLSYLQIHNSNIHCVFYY